MELILHTDLLCRACVSPLREERYNLIETPNLFELYIRLSTIHISPNDLLPKSICSRCHRLLHDFQDFQRMCVDSNKMLLDRIGSGASKLENDELAIRNESSSEVLETMIEFSDIKLECNAPDRLTNQTNPDVDENIGLILENNDYDPRKDQEHEESFDSPQKRHDIQPNDDLKYQVLAEKLEDIVTGINNSEWPEECSPIRSTRSETLREKTDALEDGTQMIVKENEISEESRITFVCEKCSKMFLTKVHYEGHLRQHEGKKPYPCQQCSAEFSRLILLKRHVSKYHTGNEVRFYCTVEGCEKNYLNRLSLGLHLSTHSNSQLMKRNKKLTKLNESSGKTLSKETLKEQEDICSMGCLDENSDLKKENSRSSQLRGKTDEESFDSHRKYNDPLPGEDVKYEVLAEQLGEIVAEIGSSQSLEECNTNRRTHSEKLRGKNKDVLENGTQVIDKKTQSSGGAWSIFVCGKCSKKFRTKVHYEGHLRWHEGKKPFACQQCSTEYSRLFELNRHVSKCHTGNEVRFYCAVKGCGKNYLNRQTLAHHMIAHSQPLDESPSKTETGTLSHTCDQCPKKFHFPNQLEEHKLEHLPVKKKEYPCEFCEVRCLHRRSLVRHIRSVHVGAKAYRCTYCNHSFAESQTLKYHVMRHTGETPFKCPYCDRKFIQKSTMKTHARRHFSKFGSVYPVVVDS